MTDVAHHQWFIEPREIERQESRRGRRHAYEWLDPRRTALVVVDIVPFFAQESAYCRGIVPNVNRLAAELRDQGGTVCWVVPGHEAPSDVTREFYGDWVADMHAKSGGEGTPRDRLWKELDVDSADVVLEKTAPSAFVPGKCGLHDLLAERGITTLVVAGTVTNVCVESTVRDASTLDYRVILVADACAATRDQDHNATLHVVYRSNNLTDQDQPRAVEWRMDHLAAYAEARSWLTASADLVLDTSHLSPEEAADKVWTFAAEHLVGRDSVDLH